MGGRAGAGRPALGPLRGGVCALHVPAEQLLMNVLEPPPAAPSFPLAVCGEVRVRVRTGTSTFTSRCSAGPALGLPAPFLLQPCTPVRRHVIKTFPMTSMCCPFICTMSLYVDCLHFLGKVHSMF